MDGQIVDSYFRALGETMTAESRELARVYRHRGKLGENREALVARFLADYLPRRHGVRSGFALLGGDVSTQQDVVVYDRLDNPVLFPNSSAPIFPPSAIEAAIEVKSRLTRAELRSTVRKTTLIKHGLRTAFAHHPTSPEMEALVALFAFESALAPAKLLVALREAQVAVADRLDMICILGEGITLGGSLLAATSRGGSADRLAVAVDNSLLLFYTRLLDYIAARPPVAPRLLSYLPPDLPLGVVVAVD